MVVFDDWLLWLLKALCLGVVGSLVGIIVTLALLLLASLIQDFWEVQ